MCEERREGENGREGGRERAGDAEKGTRVWMSCVWGRAGGKVRGRESAGRTRWVVGSASVFLGGVYTLLAAVLLDPEQTKMLA